MVLQAGARLGPYEVLSPIGSGGMGEVYRARDPRLDRSVAVKVLPEHLVRDPEALARFEREAKIVASLSHPHILAIHDFGIEHGISFAVMELLEGETLRSRLSRAALPWRNATEIALAIADGIAVAHSKGVIHRDLKPENIFLTIDGLVKILDFGLAQSETGVLSSNQSMSTLAFRTQAGCVMGTIGYMSPEQVRGNRATASSDIFSLGCVLYEMIMGRHPFIRESAADTLASILKDEPPRLESRNKIPADLERVLKHCLAKDPHERFQSARDLANDLRDILSDSGKSKVSARKAQPLSALAVLPFVNLSADPEAEYLSDGITEQIINSLSQIPKLRVMARSIAFRYKGKKSDPQKIGRDLKVSTILTGRVTQRGDTVTIGAELLDVANGWRIWGEQYSCEMADIFSIQEEIASRISDKLRIKLTGAEKKRLTKRYTENSAAYKLYLKGRYCWNRRTEEGLKKSIEYFELAIKEDPTYALAHSGLADSCALLGIAEYGALPPREAMPRAKAAALKALELDPKLAEAHTSLAHVTAFYDWNWSAAENAFKRAIEVNPSYAMAHHWYALYLVAMGRMDQALTAEKKAQELEPLSLIINKNVGTILYYAGRYDQAIEEYQKALELDPDFVRSHFFLGLAYEKTGQFDEAISEFRKAISLSGGSTVMMAALGSTYAFCGEREQALKIIGELVELSKQRYVPSFNMALIYAGLRDNDRAFEWLEKSYEERSSWLASLRVEPLFEHLASDSRFQDLVRRIGLPQS